MFLRQILSCYNLKTSFAKLVKVLVLELFYGTRTQGLREGGQGGTMTPGPMVFRGPMNPNALEK